VGESAMARVNVTKARAKKPTVAHTLFIAL
jgi:hypothetical protein